ncbi:hypothetical protein [Phocaeicola sp.]|jgi:ABC-type uncharacterized transport system fused permease/ATPase subunit|uniref:hypothetical protein n=1 Tax=Phocaeicola sp. TaxID=2773926 RepID=UPI003077A59A
MTDNKDNGLRKAARQNYTPRLSSNFTYRTMKRIAEEMYLREKRQEKRMFILMIITVACMFTGCIGMVVWAYGKEIAEALYIMTHSLPEPSSLIFYLPMLIALPLLRIFDRWLRRKYKHLL